MNRWVRLLSMLLTLLLIASAANAVSFPQEATLRTNAHLRTGPSTQTESKMVLMRGYTVTLTGQQGEWFAVAYGAFTGFIRGDLINLPKETPTPPPQSPPSQPTAPPASQPTAPPTPSGQRNLKQGLRGEDVRLLQESLSAIGLDVGKIDGVFGKKTRAAVMTFQREMGLKVDGIAGVMTLASLEAAVQAGVAVGSGQIPTDPAQTPVQEPMAPVTQTIRTLKNGMIGEDVSTVQRRLAAFGYLGISPTGEYGATTIAAVKAFQTAHGLKADGVCGPKTLSALLSDSVIPAATTTAPPLASDPLTASITLSYGAKGETVRTLQRALAALGYYTEGVDGDFGAGTQAAVRQFQQVHGLTQTGAADASTQALLYGGSAQLAPAPTPFVPQYPGAGKLAYTPSSSQVRFADWDTDVKRSYRSGQTISVYDFNAGLGWQLRIYAMGQHADSEPLTAADTEVMYRAFGLKNTWSPRPVWAIMPDGRVLMASIHNMPHLTGSISDNNFDGHLCLHFPRSMELAVEVGSYAVTHQNCILRGWSQTTGQ